jgi:hypothetical protein
MYNMYIYIETNLHIMHIHIYIYAHAHTHARTHTLAQKYLIELLMWNASNVHKQSPKV